MFPPPPPPPRSKKGKYALYALLGAGALAYASYSYLQAAYHGYPPAVLELLRLGLAAESSADGNEPDYKAALYCFLQALEEADKSDLHFLSDEYTGVQLKVAEMYEKLGMVDEARLMYRELCTAFIQALADESEVPAKLRPLLIQRGLRVALKTAYLESSINVDVAKMSLMVHFMMAQDEVAKRSPEMAKLIKGGNTQKSFNIPLSLDGEPTNSEFHEAWQPFRDELFSARDMFVALCIATGDIGLAIQTKLASTEWMAVSGYNSSDTLMSFYNVGAIFYLQAESLDLHDRGANPPPVHVSPHARPAAAADPALLALKDLSKTSMANASACFEMVLKLIGKLPSRVRREGDIDDVQALATYGMGVIALHKGDFDKASDLLREARLRAKGCGYTDLVKNSETELEKLDAWRKNESMGEDMIVPIVPPVVSLKKNTHQLRA